MPHTAPPLDAVWQIVTDLQNDQRATASAFKSDIAASGLGYAYAYASLAEALIEAGVLDRDRLIAWIEAARAHAQAHVEHEMPREILDRLADLIAEQMLPDPV